MSEFLSNQPSCAYEKKPVNGQIPCSVAYCAVNLFIREGEKPVNLTSFAICGVPITPAGTHEWQVVEQPRSTARLSNGNTVEIVRARYEHAPINI